MSWGNYDPAVAEKAWEKWHAYTLAALDAACDYALERGMDYGDVQNIRWAVLNSRTIAWGADGYAGAKCPLKAAGYERQHGFHGPWLVKGGHDFMAAWDQMMSRRLLGPGMVGVPKVAA